jgi:hypothetical protein
MVAAFWLTSKQGDMADTSRSPLKIWKACLQFAVGAVGEAGGILINALAYFMK